MPSQLKQLLLGRPLNNREAMHQRLSNPVALAVFSSDALSSVAYATEEILLALVVAGSAPLKFALPISIGIGVLLLIVAASYRQTIKAYPNGGGAYIVAKDNPSNSAGLVAGRPPPTAYVPPPASPLDAAFEPPGSDGRCRCAWDVNARVSNMDIDGVAA